MTFTYGLVEVNNGDKFRARKDEDTGKVSYMSHHGQKNASVKIAKSFRPGDDSAVPASKRYLFPDEYHNPNQSIGNSASTAWKLH